MTTDVDGREDSWKLYKIIVQGEKSRKESTRWSKKIKYLLRRDNSKVDNRPQKVDDSMCRGHTAHAQTQRSSRKFITQSRQVLWSGFQLWWIWVADTAHAKHKTEQPRDSFRQGYFPLFDSFPVRKDDRRPPRFPACQSLVQFQKVYSSSNDAALRYKVELLKSESLV